MKALVVIAHGSKLKSSNDEIKELVKNIAKENKELLVEYSFLEFAKPSLFDAIKTTIENGATDVSVFPYFLAAGKHVRDDIPKEVSRLKELYEGVNIKILPHFGKARGIENLILKNVF